MLADWSKWLAAQSEAGRNAYVYFNNDPGGAAARDAMSLTAMLRGATAGAGTRSA